MHDWAPEGLGLHRDAAVQEQIWVTYREKAKASLYFLNKGILKFDRLQPHLHLPAANYLQLLPWECPWRQARFKLYIKPRDHYKSTQASVGLPIWLNIRDPNMTCRIVSAIEDNSVGWLFAIREIYKTNELFRWLFPEVIPDWAKTLDSATAFTSQRTNDASPETQPTFRAASIQSGQASKHVNFVLCDDLVNEMTMDSPRLVQRAVDFYKLVESTMKDWKESALWLTGTPWGFADVIEYALEHEVALGEMLYWKIGCYGKFEASPELLADPAQRFTYRGAEGDPILPDRHPRADLARLEKKYGPFRFSCNYLCNPFDDKMSGFKTSTLRYYTRRIDGLLSCACELHGACKHRLRDLSWGMVLDPAFSDEDEAAESALVVAGIAADGCRFLFEAWSGREDPSALWVRMVDFVGLYAPWLRRIGIEAVASQKLFGFWARFMQNRDGALPGVAFVDVVPDTRIRKEVRIRAQELPLANGQWHIKAGLDGFMGQFAKFPRVRPIDILDAWAYLDQVWGAEMPVQPDPKHADVSTWNRIARELAKGRLPYGAGRARTPQGV